MAVNLSIRNVPDDVVRGLRNRAALHQRSLQQELLEILKEAAEGQGPVSIDSLLSNAERKRPALDEAASRALANREAEQERAAQRFKDLMAGAGETSPEERPNTEDWD